MRNWIKLTTRDGRVLVRVQHIESVIGNKDGVFVVVSGRKDGENLEQVAVEHPFDDIASALELADHA